MNINKYKSESSNSAGGGIGFIGLLQIAFIVLKLCKVINWSWIKVLAPLWVSAILFGIILIVVIIIVAIKKVQGGTK